MTAATQTLTDFILVQIAKDEAVARAAVFQTFGWRVSTQSGHVVEAIGIGDHFLADTSTDPESGNLAVSTHIARHDPARVLAECEAYRAIVRLHAGAHDCKFIQGHDACATLTHLAAVYADREGFREEWRL